MIPLSKNIIGWRDCLLSDVLKLKNGYAFKSNKYEESGIPIIRISDIKDGVISSKNAMCIHEDSIFDNYIVEKGDILIAMSGATTGKFGLYFSEKKAYQNQRVGNFKLHSEKDIDKTFIFYLLYSLKRQIEKDAYGGAQPNISATKIESLRIALPPKNEQHRIVSKIDELFSELDKGIESLKTAREQLKVYRQALLKHAFEGKLTEQWRKDNADDVQGSTSAVGAGNIGTAKLETAEQLLERIKQDRESRYQQQLDDWKEAIEQWESKGKNGKKPTKPSKYKYEKNGADKITASNSVPTNWKRILLEEIILDGPTNGYSPKSGNDAKGTHSLKLTATTSCKMILNEDTIKNLYEVIPDNSKHWLEPNDLLVQRANAIKYLGSTAIYTGKRKKYIYPDLMMRLRFNSINLTKYIWFYLNGHEARMYFQNNATGIAGSMPKISGAILRSTPISLPPINEIDQITELLDNNLSSISLTENELNNQIKKSESLRQSILKKAFSGKLVAQDPKDEPASELLKRIEKEKAELEAREKAAKAAIKKSKPKPKRKKVTTKTV